MPKKLDADALFEEYAAMGPSRSYEALAERHGVSKRSITRIAKREGWQARIAEREQKARAASDAQAVESLADMRRRHIRATRVMQMKALDVLRQQSLASAMDAVRTLDLALKQERALVGDGNHHEPQNVPEEVVRKVRQERLELYALIQQKNRLLEEEKEALRERAELTEATEPWDGQFWEPEPRGLRDGLPREPEQDASSTEPPIGFDPFAPDGDENGW